MNRNMSKLLIPEPPLQILPQLACTIGLNEAIIVQQLHYWSLKAKDGWVYNTYEQWHEQFPFWSVITIKRTFLKLEQDGIVVSRQSKSTNRKKFYRINYEKLDNAFSMYNTEPEYQNDTQPTGQIDTIATCQNDTLLITETTTIDSDLQSVEPETEPALEPKPKRKGKARTAKYTIDQIRPMANAIASVTALKYADNIPVLHKISSNLLDGGYTPQKVADFAVWWKVNDWRGRKGQPPTPWQLKSMIGGALKQGMNGTGDPASEEKRKKFLEQIQEQR